MPRYLRPHRSEHIGALADRVEDIGKRAVADMRAQRCQICNHARILLFDQQGRLPQREGPAQLLRGDLRARCRGAASSW